MTIAYGMTETSPLSFQTLVDTPVKRRCSSIGTVHPNVEAKIVDEKDNTVERNKTGEL